MDIIRTLTPDVPVYFGMLITSMSDRWAPRKTDEMMAAFRAEFESFTGHPVGDAALRAAIAAHNADRQLLRSLFDARQAGQAAFTPVQLQDLVKSSMVMDPRDHLPLLQNIARRPPRRPGATAGVRVHRSGAICPDISATPEAGVARPDRGVRRRGGRRRPLPRSPVHHDGRREDVDPIDALSQWYFDRNVNVPCPTRVQHDADWDTYLLRSVTASGADGVIVSWPSSASRTCCSTRSCAR